MPRLLLILGLLAGPLLSPAGAQALPELKASLNSAFLVAGEEATLTLEITATERPFRPPEPPVVQNVTFTPQKEQLRLMGGLRRYIYPFTVRSFEEGTHYIPPISIQIGTRTFRSQPLQLHVSHLNVDSWKQATVAGTPIDYAAAIFIPPRPPYVGETIPVEAKIYLPKSVPLVESSVANIPQTGVATPRFETTKDSRTSVRLNSKEYIGLSYRSTTSPLQAGPVALGPGSIRLILQTRVSRAGQFEWQAQPWNFEIPARPIDARALPPNPPPAFSGAVGSFRLSVLADTSSLSDGDPITVRLSVAGRGNLDTLPPPTLEADATTWRVLEPSRLPRQGERRDISGVVSFSQIIRPLTAQSVIPPFALHYFDPAAERYEVTRSAAIPFQLKAGSTNRPPPALVDLPDRSTPVEEMESILGLVDPTREARSPDRNWTRHWQWIPALLALVLVARIIHQRLLPRFQRPPRERELEAALGRVEEAGPDQRSFLRAAGHFIESWIPDAQREEGALQELLERRNRDCYQPQAGTEELDAGERRTILHELRTQARRAAPLIAILAAMLTAGADPALAALELDSTGSYRQADLAWSRGDYQDALLSFQSAHPDGDYPADVLYNLGNCHFQLSQPGLAALFYHRALLADPRHPEARQNLRFLTRKLGSISVSRPAHQELLGTYDRSLYRTILSAGLWLTGLAALGLLAFAARPLRILTWCGLAAGTLTSLAGGAALVAYPGDAEFAPVSEQAVVITAEPATARTEAGTIQILGADPEAPKVISAPPGSLCRILARRGTWFYVEFANQTRGWLSANEVQPIVPSPASEVELPGPGAS